MSGGSQQYQVDEIIGHMKTKDLVKEGSTLSYDEKDLLKSECPYAFQVSWVGYEGEDTWQSYESFGGDKRLPRDYARRISLDLTCARKKFSSSEDLRRRVDEIEENQRRRHEGQGSSRSNHSPSPSMTKRMKPDYSDSKSCEISEKKKKKVEEVILLSSEDDEKEKKRSAGDKRAVKTVKTQKIDTDEISSSSVFVTYPRIPGFKVYLPIEKKHKTKKN
ncbi:hypothetical protein PMAYCL1PPCAC_18461 [Pristionchus mayeri]|uniref:Chromo domain-containing protein n=1 Tax=Pristionchus mayeri TaxID=1317129 RepID=A0AAN5I1B7_9BILA|nr:hypothetical protein PMAYCL1PPCAC_18461 [Pristionchus mayeri]